MFWVVARRCRYFACFRYMGSRVAAATATNDRAAYIALTNQKTDAKIATRPFLFSAFGTFPRDLSFR